VANRHQATGGARRRGQGRAKPAAARRERSERPGRRRVRRPSGAHRRGAERSGDAEAKQRQAASHRGASKQERPRRRNDEGDGTERHEPSGQVALSPSPPRSDGPSIYFAGGRGRAGDLTALTGAAPAGGDPHGYARADGVSSVVYRALDNRVFELWLDMTGWHAGALTNAPGAVLAGGDPHSLPFCDPDYRACTALPRSCGAPAGRLRPRFPEDPIKLPMREALLILFLCNASTRVALIEHDPSDLHRTPPRARHLLPRR
jgi:hypothetical protein